MREGESNVIDLEDKKRKIFLRGAIDSFIYAAEK